MSLEHQNWAKMVHAAKLLHDLFNDVSGNTVEFDKTKHSLRLTEWLLANKPNVLNELVAYVRAFAGD